MQAMNRLQGLGDIQSTPDPRNADGGDVGPFTPKLGNILTAGGVQLQNLITPDSMKWNIGGVNPQVLQTYQQAMFPGWDWNAVTAYQNQRAEQGA